MLSSGHTRLLSRLVPLVGGTALGVLLLVFLFRSVNLNQLGDDFSNVDYRYLALAVVPFLINLLLKVPRWALLYGDDAPHWDTLFGAMNVGYAINALLPARLGEIVRAYWIRDRARVAMLLTLSNIALERVMDGMTLLVMLFVTAPTVAFPRKLLGPAVSIGVVFVAVLLGMIVVAYSSTRQDHPLSRMLLQLERGSWAFVGRAVRQAVLGLKALRSWRAVLLLVTYTAIIWLCGALTAWLVLRAFHIDVPVTAALLLTAVLNLGMVIPSSPGYVGVFESLMVLILGLYRVGRTPALAAALAFHAFTFVPVTIIGLIYIARLGAESTLQMVRRSAESSAGDSAPSSLEGQRGL